MKETRLKWLLITRKLSQSDVMTLMTENALKPPMRYVLTELCNGKRPNPKIDTLQKIADALEVEVSFLLPLTEKITKRAFNKWEKARSK